MRDAGRIRGSVRGTGDVRDMGDAYERDMGCECWSGLAGPVSSQMGELLGASVTDEGSHTL